MQTDCLEPRTDIRLVDKESPVLSEEYLSCFCF